MWTNAQRDGRSAEYRWRPLSNAAKFGWRPLLECMPYSNAAKTRNPLKFALMPQTPEQISAISGLRFTILWEHLEEILLLNKIFLIVDTCLNCEDVARQSCAMVHMVNFWRFFASCIFSERRAQHVSDLHPKFALRLRDVWKYGRHPVCDGWD